jgi:Outer membrane protein beta-barrel domain
MKTRTPWFFVAALLLLAASSTLAQGRFEVTPFVGYETSATYPISVFTTGANVDHLRVNDAVAYGTFLDFNLTENTQLEFMWNRNNTSYSARDSLTRTYFKAYDSDIDQYQFGALYTFLNSEHRLRPYIAGSVGFTHDANSNLAGVIGDISNRTEFSYSIGGGVKYYVSRHLGFRGDARYLPTYGSSSNGVYCDPFFGCYNAKIAHYLNRGSFVGGIILRF